MLTTIRRPELTPEERESRMQEIKTAAVRLLLAAERGENMRMMKSIASIAGANVLGAITMKQAALQIAYSVWLMVAGQALAHMTEQNERRNK